MDKIAEFCLSRTAAVGLVLGPLHVVRSAVSILSKQDIAGVVITEPCRIVRKAIERDLRTK